MTAQACPNCGSKNIRAANVIPIGDPVKAEGLYGWECLECGYVGKDFFVKE